MLKVLFITASKDASGRTNVGDRVILAGARNLVAGAFGAYAYREIGRWGEFPDAADDYDLVVYAGMPQYGGRSGPTAVEQRFQAYLDSARKASFINIGGGTPTGIDLDVEGSSTRMAASGIGDFYRAQSGIKLRTTRDLVGKRFFDRIDSPCDLRPCPSFFSTMHVATPEKTRNAIAFLSDDSFVTSRVRGSMHEHLRRLIDRLPGYELAAHSKGDLAQLGRFGLEHVYFRSELDAIDYYGTVGRLASLRIHAGVPCWTLGGDVVVGAFDGRARMFADVGMPLPVIDLVANDFTVLADLVEDPATHTPMATRRRLIDEAYTSFVVRLRGACPDLAARAETTVEAVPGFSVYPFEGRVEPLPGAEGFLPPRLPRPPRFVPESDPSDRGCVVIPAGTVAVHGHEKPVELPVVHDGAEFTAATGQKIGRKLELSLAAKKGALARGPQIRLPFGTYRVGVELELASRDGAPIKKPFQLVLIAKTSHAPYGESTTAFPSLDGGVVSAEIGMTFENTFPSAALVLDVVLRGNTVPVDARIVRLTIDTAAAA